jgi:hypothetical protein
MNDLYLSIEMEEIEKNNIQLNEEKDIGQILQKFFMAEAIDHLEKNDHTGFFGKFN